jgi:hypothetical protein
MGDNGVGQGRKRVLGSGTIIAGRVEAGSTGGAKSLKRAVHPLPKLLKIGVASLGSRILLPRGARGLRVLWLGCQLRAQRCVLPLDAQQQPSVAFFQLRAAHPLAREVLGHETDEALVGMELIEEPEDHTLQLHLALGHLALVGSNQVGEGQQPRSPASTLVGQVSRR